MSLAETLRDAEEPHSRRAEPFLQQLLRACWNRTQPKTAPEDFDWSLITPAKLRSYEKARARMRRNGGGKTSAEAHRRAMRVWRQRHKQQHAAKARNWRKSETGQRYEQRLIAQNYRETQRAGRDAARRGLALVGLALKDLETPTYRIIAENGTRYLESWPLRDPAAEFIRTEELKRTTERANSPHE